MVRRILAPEAGLIFGLIWSVKLINGITSTISIKTRPQQQQRTHCAKSARPYIGYVLQYLGKSKLSESAEDHHEEMKCNKISLEQINFRERFYRGDTIALHDLGQHPPKQHKGESHLMHHFFDGRNEEDSSAHDTARWKRWYCDVITAKWIFSTVIVLSLRPVTLS